MKYIISIFLAMTLVGCGHKKIVAKNCDKAGNADIYVCDQL